MVDADSFASMPTGVCIVKTSRGGIIGEDALADAIRSGQVAGGALDVSAIGYVLTVAWSSRSRSGHRASRRALGRRTPTLRSDLDRAQLRQAWRTWP